MTLTLYITFVLIYKKAQSLKNFELFLCACAKNHQYAFRASQKSPKRKRRDSYKPRKQSKNIAPIFAVLTESPKTHSGLRTKARSDSDRLFLTVAPVKTSSGLAPKKIAYTGMNYQPAFRASQNSPKRKRRDSYKPRKQRKKHRTDF